MLTNKQEMNMCFSAFPHFPRTIHLTLWSLMYNTISISVGKPTFPLFNFSLTPLHHTIISQSMEIELGLKVSRPSHEAISTNPQITKGGCNPLFLSIETKAMFILTANLKGYPREKLKIDINGDRTEIAISGEKGDEVWGFRKVFRIPSGVVLNGINATFNEKESVLKILMPKSVKRISGVGIQEVKEEETDEMAHPEAAKVEADKVNQGAQICGLKKTHRSQRQDDHPEEVEGMGNDIPAQADWVEVAPPQEIVDDDRNRSLAPPSTKSKLCSPCFLAGSAILVSIIAIAVHYIRPKTR